MAPFSIPAPHIVPLRISPFGAPKSIDSNTKIELLCETPISHEIFYTLDGTKPQPYAGIVQGSKTIKYVSPFSLPAGKVVVKAIAVHAKIHSMFSNVIIKTFDVVKVSSKNQENCHIKQGPKKKKKKEKPADPVSLNESSVSKGIQELASNHISDNSANSSKKSFSDGGKKVSSNDHLSDKEDILKQFDQCSLDSGSVGESLEDDKTIYDIDEASLLEEIPTQLKSSTPLQEKEDVTPNFPVEKNGLHEISDIIQFESSGLNINYPLSKLDEQFESCFVCHEMNPLASKFCIHCGGCLKKICRNCNEVNPLISKFCQYCGHKLNEGHNEKHEISLNGFSKQSFVEKKNVSLQSTALCMDKNVQTSPLKMPKNSLPNVSPINKRLPPHSPGRGYWHQQLDFICNHLKSYAYNNIDFRKSISQPILSTFQSAEVTQNEDNISVTLIFSSLNNENRSQN